ncbi:receptor-like protein 9DC3 [Impatiens glandulifera]|uniref:receptor-like protein 9DC3 n=1 Tax=Impatiens glandulifera TaxID=253017 RepID=UPI001FB079F3|nr:receptor-like protein 9DC3 [Impatiens glandulifera]
MKTYLVMCRLLLIITLQCMSMQSHQVLSSSNSLASIPSNLSCPNEQLQILLQFKHMFPIDHKSPNESFCGYEPSYPKTISWNESNPNCCSWNGVTCNDLTGEVIGIDLSCSQLSGTFHPNTTLFNLPSLTNLNLAFNNFHSSPIPSSIGILAPTITHLNLSTSSFAGPIPSEIAHLSKLVLLDLSGGVFSPDQSNYTRLRLEKHDFQYIISNLTQLEILYLNYINMSSCIIPDSIVNLTSLTSLYLIYNIGLYGEVPDGVFNLPALQYLFIWNYYELNGSFHNVNWNISGTNPLKDLELTSISLSGGLPDSIGYLRSLNYLAINNCNLLGPFPDSIGNLSQLIGLSLRSNNFTGLIPHSLSNLNELKYLYLSYNEFEGQIPTNMTSLQKLYTLDLRNNLLQGSIPVGLFEFPNLFSISLDNNMLSGALPSIFFKNHSKLTYFTISKNNLSGPIPQSISNLRELYQFDLSFNNFDGTLYLDTFSNTTRLAMVYLENNENLSVVDAYGNFSTITSLDLSSCQLQNFPVKFLTTSKNLQFLDLSKTGVNGQIPEWIGEMSSMRLFRASNNKIKGEIPSSICNMSFLLQLKLSYNELDGPIPPCFGNFSMTLSVLDLRNNNLEGGIPTTYSKDNMLIILALNGNHLQGSIPKSLSLCNHLQVLDFGNNMINGTFPSWVDALPELQVLILRFNKLHGLIDISKTTSPFPKLRIFDVSHNEFTGLLPSYYFSNFNDMKTLNQKSISSIYSSNMFYQVSVTITMKGHDAHIEGFILESRTIIDLSSNKFEGAINPIVVGNLVGLTILNMSNNHLTGHIPVNLGNLVQLESLDLSSNQLIGEIPQELTSLTFLEVLNLSCNRLEGHIPQGKQFNTFSNDSYLENMALCGSPLSTKCEWHEMETPPPGPPPHDDSEDDSFWQGGLMGYTFGMIIGLAAGCLSFYTGRPKWFATMMDGIQKKS